MPSDDRLWFRPVVAIVVVAALVATGLWFAWSADKELDMSHAGSRPIDIRDRWESGAREATASFVAERNIDPVTADRVEVVVDAMIVGMLDLRADIKAGRVPPKKGRRAMIEVQLAFAKDLERIVGPEATADLRVRLGRAAQLGR